MGEREEMKLLFTLPVPADVGAKGARVNQPRVMIKKRPFTIWLTRFITESNTSVMLASSNAMKLSTPGLRGDGIPSNNV